MTMPGIAEGIVNKGTLTPDNLIAGDYPRVTRIVTITGGAILAQGSVLGQITETGNGSERFQLSEVSLTNGAEIPDALLAEDVDPTDGDVQAHVYITGDFNAQALTLGAGHTLTSVRKAFRQRSLFLRNNLA